MYHKASSDRKLYVYLFCLFLSIFFWLLNALGNSYITKVVFDVTYLNQPKELVVLNELPTELSIQIKGLGFDLMGYKLKINQPSITVDLATLKNIKSIKGVYAQAIPSNNFKSDISTQLGQHIEIQNIAPDSIHFLMDKQVEKLLPIIPTVNITYAKQYQLFGKIIIKPTVVKVTGAASILDTLTEIYTAKIELENLDESTNETVPYAAIYENLKLSFKPKKILLYVPVEKFTETIRTVKINTINVPDSIDLKTIPTEVEVKFMLPLSKIVSLESAIFKANVDFKDIGKHNNRKLKVNLVSSPNYIKSIRLSPSKVEYILKKQHD